jgi:hypothetical protein
MFLATVKPLYIAAGTICETGETGENACLLLKQFEFLTGLTGLPPFPPVLQESDFEAGQTH